MVVGDKVKSVEGDQRHGNVKPVNINITKRAQMTPNSDRKRILP